MPEHRLQSGTHQLTGPIGNIEILIDAPNREPAGLVVIAHPQPLLGGSAKHKIPHLLARALCDEGWLVVRPNFRGVGLTDGEHDRGFGETDDILHLIDWLIEGSPTLQLALVGFSFGAFVQSRVARKLADRGTPVSRVVLIGLPNGDVEGQRNYKPEGALTNALIVHGECDERVALNAVLDWARPHAQPVVVVPGADHFFTGKLPVLRSLVLSHFSLA